MPDRKDLSAKNELNRFSFVLVHQAVLQKIIIYSDFSCTFFMGEIYDYASVLPALIQYFDFKPKCFYKAKKQNQREK